MSLSSLINFFLVRALNRSQRLIKIGNNVIDMLDPDRKPNISVADTCLNFLLLRQLGMGRSRRMNRKAPCVSDIGDIVKHLKAIDEFLTGFLSTILELEAH